MHHGETTPATPRHLAVDVNYLAQHIQMDPMISSHVNPNLKTKKMHLVPASVGYKFSHKPCFSKKVYTLFIRFSAAYQCCSREEFLHPPTHPERDKICRNSAPPGSPCDATSRISRAFCHSCCAAHPLIAALQRAPGQMSGEIRGTRKHSQCFKRPQK